MPDLSSPLAALVYDDSHDPDALLRAFADALNGQGIRAVGLVQIGHRDHDVAKLDAVLLHSGEQLRLFQDLGPGATGCKLDIGQLLDAGSRVAEAIDAGADVVIINRFGKQECEGKGLAYLIARALSDAIPVVIAVPSQRLDQWTAFADGMSVQLACSRAALDAWWQDVGSRSGAVEQRTLRADVT
jgi:nucleoside-triphosphatase THEP1